MKKYVCIICGFEYNENTESAKFSDLPNDWVCPDCGAVKGCMEEEKTETVEKMEASSKKSKVDENALYKASCGLYMLIAKDGGKDNACVINTFLQVTSNDPIRCVITVNKQNYTHDMIMNTRKLNLSVLTTETTFDLIKRFGFASGITENKFDGFNDFARSENGLIYFTKFANSYMSFDVENTEDFGSHTMFKCVISESEIIGNQESLTYSYYFKNIKQNTDTSKKSGHQCKICGYVYEGDVLPDDYVCPLCKHGAKDFIKL